MPISQSEDNIGLHQPMRGLDSDTVWWASDEMTDEQSPITQAAAGMEAFEKLEICTHVSRHNHIEVWPRSVNKILKRFIWAV